MSVTSLWVSFPTCLSNFENGKSTKVWIGPPDISLLYFSSPWLARRSCHYWLIPHVKSPSSPSSTTSSLWPSDSFLFLWIPFKGFFGIVGLLFGCCKTCPIQSHFLFDFFFHLPLFCLSPEAVIPNFNRLPNLQESLQASIYKYFCLVCSVFDKRSIWVVVTWGWIASGLLNH